MGVLHEEEHVEGARCCPENRDGCKANNTLGMGHAYCGDGAYTGYNKQKTLSDGTVCMPKLGGFYVVIKHLITTLGATFVSDVVRVAVKISF